nr:hypothetical protein [Tanacetum cinerariifolium]
MAYVAPQSHNWDAGGDPPDDQQPRILPHQCQGYCTREQLENLKRQHASQKEEQAFESQQNALKNFVDFFNRHQGAHSQFQIHDLYTPQVFPRSISTPSGPSFTSPASSSTPFALSYCYTPTFHPETSQSGQQDNNGSDDRNRENDVDIYDEE